MLALTKFHNREIKYLGHLNNMPTYSNIVSCLIVVL